MEFATRGSSGICVDEYRFMRASGGYADVVDRGHIVRDPDGRATRMIGAMQDITLRKRGEARLAAMLRLGDRLRDLTEPDEISFAGCEVLGEVLGISRVGYGVIDNDKETIDIDLNWNAPGVASLAGTLRFRDYGSYIDDLKRGETAIVSDATRDPRTRDTCAALQAIHARAFVNMPLVEHGRSVALLYLNDVDPRSWSEDDLSLAREVAERVRQATERARSEVALRESERQFRAFAQAVPNHVWASRPDGHLYWFNDQVTAYSGEAPDALYGPTEWSRIVHPDDLAAAGKSWLWSLSTGTVYETEFRIRRADGDYRWFLVRAEPVTGADGRIAEVGRHQHRHRRPPQAGGGTRRTRRLAGTAGRRADRGPRRPLAPVDRHHASLRLRRADRGGEPRLDGDARMARGRTGRALCLRIHPSRRSREEQVGSRRPFGRVGFRPLREPLPSHGRLVPRHRVVDQPRGRADQRRRP